MDIILIKFMKLYEEAWIMKKCFIVLTLLIFIITGCRKYEKQQEVPEEISLQEQQDSVILEHKIKLDTFAKFIGMQKEVVLKELGNEYKVQPIGISKLDQGYYFDNIKTAFFFNGDQRLQYIEYQGEAEFFNKEIGGDFRALKEVYGETDIVKYDILEEGKVREGFYESADLYEISYLESDYLISFVSKEETGRDFTTYLYKPVGFLSSEEMKELLYYDTNRIQERFGLDFVMSRPVDELFPYWDYYKAIGLYFGTNVDSVEEDTYIQFAPWIQFSSINAGMTFDEVKQKLGDSLIIKEVRYMMNYIVYSIEYRYGDYFLQIESNNVSGDDSRMQIALTKEGYRDKIIDDVEWKFKDNKVFFNYRGEEYVLNLEYEENIIPIYDSSDYKKYQIPEEALGAGFYELYSVGMVDNFYVAFDGSGNLNLYTRKIDFSSENTPYHLQQVIITSDSYAPKYVMEDYKSNEEISLDDVSDEVKKSINDINNALLNRKLYQCFSLEDYDFYYSNMSWPDVLEKEILYDFNKDKKLEALKIRCIFDTRYEETATLEPKEAVFEITLGDKKIIVKLDSIFWNKNFEVGICDVDLEDNYVEFYTTQFEDCYGSSLLFRLNGNSLEEAVDTDYEEIVGVSGEGRIYIWNGSFRRTYSEDESYEDFLLWYLDYKTGNFISSDHMIGKQYLAISYGDILFREFEDVPWGPPVEITLDLPGAFYEPKEGEILTVLDKDDRAQAIKVRTKDGQEGWIGGHHMVWN